MNKNFYATLCLVTVLVCLTKDALARTVASVDPPPSSSQSLMAPSLEEYNYHEGTDIYLSFHNPNAGAATELWRSTNSESGYQLITTVPSGTDDYYDRDLKPRTTFYYKARAVLNGNYSDFSSVVSYDTYSKWYEPEFTVTLNPAGDTVIITLKDRSYADAYYQLTRNGYDFWGFDDIDSGRTVIYKDGDVLPNTTYTYELTATLLEDGFPVVEAGEGTVTTSGASTNCANVGWIYRERWDNIPGTEVSAIPTGTRPDKVTALDAFVSPTNEGTNYGARIRGYVCVPQTGNYTFWISSDDKSELWLSTDDNPANRRKIASVTGYTSPQQWTKYASQKSALISLVGGRRYYIEALHKEASGGDNLAVGWQLPNGTMERPIPGNRLIEFPRTNLKPEVEITSPAEGQTFTAPANITFTATASDPDSEFVTVDFWNGTTRIGQDISSPYSYTWQNVPPGTYTIEARAWDSNSSSRDGTSDYVTFTVVGGCEGAGTIQREIWQNITGTSVSSVPFNTPPTNYEQHANFETGQYWGNNYGSRMRGYICVPQTGNYTFWISSDDNSQLWLSTDESASNKKLIASVTGATGFRVYNKYASQQSAPIALVGGRKYYIEALHKEGTGNDFVSVGWQLPGGAMERPIPGNRLIPINLIGDNRQPSVTLTAPADNSTFTAGSNILLKATASDPDGEIYSVRFEANSVVLNEDFTAPYEFQWNNVPAGNYSVIARAADSRGASSIDQISITVGATGPCSNSGKIYREIWTGIPGTSISSIPVNSAPNRVVELTNFSTPTYYGNDYGSRIRGYLCVPVSGVYRFFIASDDNGELWLSTDENPANKRRIAYVEGAVPPGAYRNRPSQESEAINLVGGQRYYIEALHKEANGNDHVSVAWQFQDGTSEAPIPGSRLIPFTDMSTQAAAHDTEGIFDEEQTSGVTLFPNPVVSGSELSISVPDDGAGEVFVDVISATGVSMQSEKLLTHGGTAAVQLDRSIVPGIYLVRVSNNRKRWASKIQVK